MGKIKLYQQETEAGVSPTVSASQTGAAITAFGNVATAALDKYVQVRDQQTQDAIYTQASQMRADWTTQMQEAYSQAGPNAAGLHKQLQTSRQQQIDSYANTLPSRYRDKALRVLGEVNGQLDIASMAETVRARGAQAKADFETLVSNSVGVVVADPAQMQATRMMAHEQIDSNSLIDTATKQGLKTDLDQSLGRAVYGNLLAKSPDAALAFVKGEGASMLDSKTLMRVPEEVAQMRRVLSAENDRREADARRERAEKSAERFSDYVELGAQGKPVDIQKVIDDPELTDKDRVRMLGMLERKGRAHLGAFDPVYDQRWKDIIGGKITDPAAAIEGLTGQQQKTVSDWMESKDRAAAADEARALRAEGVQAKTAIAQFREESDAALLASVATGQGVTPEQIVTSGASLSMQKWALAQTGGKKVTNAQAMESPAFKGLVDKQLSGQLTTLDVRDADIPEPLKKGFYTAISRTDRQTAKLQYADAVDTLYRDIRAGAVPDLRALQERTEGFAMRDAEAVRRVFMQGQKVPPDIKAIRDEVQRQGERMLLNTGMGLLSSAPTAAQRMDVLAYKQALHDAERMMLEDGATWDEIADKLYNVNRPNFVGRPEIVTRLAKQGATALLQSPDMPSPGAQPTAPIKIRSVRRGTN